MAMLPQLFSLSGLAVELGLDRRTVAAKLRDVRPDGILPGGTSGWHLNTALRALDASRFASSRSGEFDPCVDGPPLARVFECLCNAGWCGHVSDLFARHTEPLAIMPSAYQVPTKSSHSRCWVELGSPDP